MRLLVALCALLHSVAAAVIGIDFGANFFKVALISARSRDMLLDSYSKRKSPQVVAFGKDERHFGNGAKSYLTKDPFNAFVSAPSLLGLPVESAPVDRLKSLKFPFEFVESERGSVAFVASLPNMEEKQELSPEVLTAMTFEYIAQLTQAELGNKRPVEAVVSVPAHWRSEQRRALLEAASLAGVIVRDLINENTAAALQYAVDYEFDESTEETLAFFNLGGGSCQVSVAHFAAVPGKQAKKKRKGSKKKGKQATGAVSVLASASDASIGGDFFDALILERLVRSAELQGVVEWSELPQLKKERLLARLRREATVAKEKLSANREWNVRVDSFGSDEVDFKLKLTREEFESDIVEGFGVDGDFVARLSQVFDAAVSQLREVEQRLADAAEEEVARRELSGIVLVGGATRIPFVKSAIESLAERYEVPLRLNLNADEAPAFGAAFRAANLSTSFRVKPLQVTDMVAHTVNAHIEGDASVREYDVETEEVLSLDREATLFYAGHPLGKRRTVTLRRDADFSVSLSSRADGPLRRFDVGGFEEAHDAFGRRLGVPKVAVVFEPQTNGLLRVVKATASWDETILVPLEKPKKQQSAKNETESEEASEKAPGTEEQDEKNTEETEQEHEEPEMIEKLVKRKFPLTVKSTTLTAIRPLSQEARVAALETLQHFRERDAETRRIAAAKNTLESFIYEHRSRLSDEDEDLGSVSTEEERDSLVELLNDAEDWLEDQHSVDNTADVFDSKLAELRNATRQVVFRFNEIDLRESAAEELRDTVTLAQTLMTKTAETRPWVEQQRIDDVLEAANEAEKWLEEQLELQDQADSRADPVVTSADIAAKSASLRSRATRTSRTRKPRDWDKQQKEKEDAQKSAEESEEAHDSTEAQTEDEETAETEEEKQEL